MPRKKAVEKGLKIVERRGIWQIDGSLLGTKVRRSTRLPSSKDFYPQALAMKVEIESQIVAGTYGKDTSSNRTVDDAIASYEQWFRAEGRITTDSARKIEKIRDTFGHIRWEDLTPAVIQDTALSSWPNLKPGSLRRYLTVLSAICNHAANRWEVKAPKVPKPTVDDTRDVHLDSSQANAVLEWIRANEPHYYPHFLTLIDTGVRLGESLRLTRPSFEADMLKVRRRLSRKSKTVTRTIPLSVDMKNLVLSGRLAQTGPVFIMKTGRPFKDEKCASTYLGKVLRTACAETGIDKVRVHDLRHTFAYLMGQAGIDLGDLQVLMGHEDISQTMRYRGFIKSRAIMAIQIGRESISTQSETTSLT